MKVCISCDQAFDDASWQCPFCLHQPKEIDGHVAFAPKLAEDNEGFNPENFATLFNLEAGNFWFRARNRLIVWALQRYFPEARNFLEIGCGTGFVLSGIRDALPSLTLSGSEIFCAGLLFAAQRLPGVELFQMDARRIPFREEYDVIGAFDVLEHVKEDEEILSQMYQATRRGGGILITVPHHPFLWSQVDDFAHHARRYQTRDLREKVERVGFSVLRLTSFVSLLLPPLILSRFKQRFTGEEVDPSAEFDIGSLMNAMFERVLDLERTMIRAGVSFPAGGSLLLVARRN